MTLNAVAAELLIEKGGFEPRVALGITEAIETSMTHAQIVTVPILDGRLQELRSEIERSKAGLEIQIERSRAELETKIERSKAELVRWVFLVMLGNVALSTGATAVLNALQHAR